MRYLSLVLISFLTLTSAAQAQNLTSSSEYSQRGIGRFEKNDLDGAIADFTKAIEMNGENLEFCYYFRGMAEYRKGNPDQAIDDISKAIALKPHPRFYDDRGNLLAKQGELDRALADLSQAIQIAPQYARAYGDRGIVRLMRGENADAELDFKKCFELDRTLESQFKAAASQVKQLAASRYEHEKPSDVEVIKFSWTEGHRSVLDPTEPSIPVYTSTVSPSGTYVLANPAAKGDPGPAQDPTGTGRPMSGGSRPGTRVVIDYKFTASIRNTGSKTIEVVHWAYHFDPKNSAQEPLAYLFASKTNIAPGKEKDLNSSVLSIAGQKGTIKLPSKSTRAFFSERINILRLEYAGGSTWQRPGAFSVPPKTPPQ